MIKESLALTIVYLHTTSAQTAYLEQTAVLFNWGKVSIMVKNKGIKAQRPVGFDWVLGLFLTSYVTLSRLMNCASLNGNPLQYSCLENSMDGGAWRAIVRGVAKSQTRLSDLTSLHFILIYQMGQW